MLEWPCALDFKDQPGFASWLCHLLCDSGQTPIFFKPLSISVKEMIPSNSDVASFWKPPLTRAWWVAGYLWKADWMDGQVDDCSLESHIGFFLIHLSSSPLLPPGWGS